MDQENRLVRTGRTYKEASSRFLSLSTTIKDGISSFLSFCESDGVAQPLKDTFSPVKKRNRRSSSSPRES